MSLFSYDEMQINMRQKGDDSYRQILSRIRIGTITNSDIATLETRKIYLQELPVMAVYSNYVIVCTYYQWIQFAYFQLVHYATL